MSSNLVDVLTLSAIQKLADTGTLARGTAYFHDGAVGLSFWQTEVGLLDVSSENT